MKRITVLIILFLLLLPTCRYNRVYHNRKYRFRIQYPQGWIAVGSGHDRAAEEALKSRMISAGADETWKNADVTFYNPDSDGPIFQAISVKSVPYRMNINNINTETLETMMTMELFQFFEEVRAVSSDIRDFKRGKIIVFSFVCGRDGTDYAVTFIVIPGKLFGSYFIKSICRFSSEPDMVIILKQVLDSFAKY